MSEHVTQWLEAYHDGELPDRRAHQIEIHLETCSECLAEFENLSRLSALLQNVPEPRNLTPPEIFTAQVGLRLLRKPEPSGWQNIFRTSWEWAPLGLIGAWVFAQTIFIVSGILMWSFRILPAAVDFAGFIPTESRETAIFGELSNLSGVDWSQFRHFGLDLLQGGGPLGWGVTLNLGLTFLVSILFFSWLASWWIQKSDRNQRSISEI